MNDRPKVTIDRGKCLAMAPLPRVDIPVALPSVAMQAFFENRLEAILAANGYDPEFIGEYTLEQHKAFDGECDDRHT